MAALEAVPAIGRSAFERKEILLLHQVPVLDGIDLAPGAEARSSGPRSSAGQGWDPERLHVRNVVGEQGVAQRHVSPTFPLE